MSAYAQHAPRRSVDNGYPGPPHAPYPDEQYHGGRSDHPAAPNGGQNGGYDHSNDEEAVYDSYYDEPAPGAFSARIPKLTVHASVEVIVDPLFVPF